MGDKRRVKYQISWRDGRITTEIESSLWLSTQPEQSDSSDSEDTESDQEGMPELIIDEDDDDSDDASELEDFWRIQTKQLIRKIFNHT